MNFITYLEPPYLLDYNYIVVPLPTEFFVSAYLNGEGVQEFLTLYISKKSENVHNTLELTCHFKLELISIQQLDEKDLIRLMYTTYKIVQFVVGYKASCLWFIRHY